MGNCCSNDTTNSNGGQGGNDEVNMQRDFKYGAGGAYQTKSHFQGNNRGGLALSQRQVLQLVRVQALWRGAITRKWVQQVYGFNVRDRNLVVYYQ